MLRFFTSLPPPVRLCLSSRLTAHEAKVSDAVLGRTVVAVGGGGGGGEQTRLIFFFVTEVSHFHRWRLPEI